MKENRTYRIRTSVAFTNSLMQIRHYFCKLASLHYRDFR